MEQMKRDNAISDGNKAIKNILGPLAALVVGILMVGMDSTAMNTMLPRLIAAFKGSYHNAQWIVTCYALAQAAIIPLTGWLSDRFGAKRIFLISIGMFTIGSMLCCSAWGIGVLAAFRAVQGLGGGMLIPIAYAYTYRLSPPGKIGQVMGIMGIPILLAPALGPVLSGWLADDVSWRWIFLINLPIGVFGLLFGMRRLPTLERQMSAAPDWLGMLLAPLAFVSLSSANSETTGARPAL